MTIRRTKKTAQIGAIEGELMPPTPQLNLHNLDAIRREMNTVYRQVRSGGLDAAEGRGLIWMLSQMGAMTKESIIERRISELEALEEQSATVEQLDYLEGSEGEEY